MALNIDGTTGISGVDGSASAPALTGTDSNTGINFASDTVNINTGGTTRATINSNGRLGIGTSSPSSVLHLLNSNNTVLTIGNSSYDDGVIQYYNGSLLLKTGASNGDRTMSFATAGSERARFLSGGQFIIGGTAVEAQGALTFEPNRDDGAGRITFNRANTTAVSVVVEFQNNNSQVGVINHDHTSCGIFTTSDYRAKENVLSISDGITRLKTLKPYKFNFIADATKTVDGFFAHEVESVVPEAITGTKDETQDILYTEQDTIPSGKKVGDVKETVPKYQAIDQSKLVPLLTAALQEAVAKIEVLETKVAALEAA